MVIVMIRVRDRPGNPYLRGRLSTFDLFVLIGFRSAAFEIENIIYFLTKQVTLIRRSSVVSLISLHRVSLPWLGYVYN
jgi:hypothetical protein